MRNSNTQLIATAAAVVAGLMTVAQPTLAQSVQTPLASVIEVEGTSGGSQSTPNCGYISATPAQVVQVTEPFASLNIHVESQGNFTVLISSPQGFSECIAANNYSNGVIDAPGLLNQGTYHIFVGDMTGASHPYTLTIEQN